MPNLAILQDLQRHAFPKGTRFLCAVSGGRDSMCAATALAHVLRTHVPEMDYDLQLVGINHGLRIAAAQELRLVAKYADQKLHLPFHQIDLHVAPGSNLMERAREERYAAIRSIDHDVLITAHHMDDLIETIYMRIIRGGSLAVFDDYLPVEQRSHGDVPRPWRPLLRLRREQITAYCKRWSVPWVDDPTNENTYYLRNKVRHVLLPQLRAINGGIDKHLLQLREDAAQLSKMNIVKV